MKWKIHKFAVQQKHEGIRLDQILSEAIEGLSRSKAKKLIDLGGVHINGRRVRNCSASFDMGDSCEVYIDHLPLDPYRITSSDIVFQDKYIIVLNKPPLVDTQPTHARYKGTVYEALQWYLKDPFAGQRKAEVGMVQRLDRGTSGLMVFSLHQHAHKQMTHVFSEHKAEKYYQALVVNHPPEEKGEVCSFLARSRKENRVKSVEKGGKKAITQYRTEDRFEKSSLLSIRILTGRSHQIRAHMSELGCPLIGDPLYDGPETFDSVQVLRPLLHANRLIFPHPVSGQKLEFNLPLPADMQNMIQRLKVNSNELS